MLLLYLILYLYTGVIVHVNLSPGNHRLGGSALAQCYNQLGDCAPDLDDPQLLAKAFDITQSFIQGCVLLCCLNVLINLTPKHWR